MYLTGVDEARLTYLAVHQWYGWSAGRQLVLDIGGGSMEIAFGSTSKMLSCSDTSPVGEVAIRGRMRRVAISSRGK